MLKRVLYSINKQLTKYIRFEMLVKSVIKL